MNKQEIDIYTTKRFELIRPLTTYGAFQRADTYKKEYSGDRYSTKRKEFRDCLFELIKDDIQVFTKIVIDDVYYEYLVDLNKRINSSEYCFLLKEDRYRIGNTQKLINLYWKMLWLMVPNIPIPIHCPFDSIIIKKLDSSVRNVAWTKFDDLNTYKELVHFAGIEAEKMKLSIPFWELKVYS